MPHPAYNEDSQTPELAGYGVAWGKWREEAGAAAIGPLGQPPMGLVSGELLEPSLEEGRRGREGDRKMEAKRS